VDWLNRNSFRQVDVIYKKGVGPQTVDLDVKVKDRFPLRFYTGFENTGNDLTGDERLLFGANWGNAFGIDHEMSYQYTTSMDFEMFQGHSLNYLAPLPWRHYLNFFGSYATSRADIAAGIPFGLEGYSWQASGRYIIPLPNTRSFNHDLILGYDFKQSNNNLEFGGTNVFDSTTDVSQFNVGYRTSLRDKLGYTNAGINIFFSPLSMAYNQKKTDYAVARSGADPTYVYVKFDLERVTKFLWDTSIMNRLSYQAATTNLLSSEQLGLGGMNSIRGYDEREVNTDGGIILNTEFRSPPISLFALFNKDTKVKDQLQFLGFWDYGIGENKFLQAGENDSYELSSVGVGARYAINPYMTFRADYGWQLLDTGFSPRHDSRCHMSMILSY
jgi:hemolysin activation/secretion protein